MEGWYLRAENGAHFVVTDDGEPFRVSDHTKNGDLFDGLTSGERVRITHDDIAETDPCQTGAYSCELLEERTPEGIPAETLTALEELGYIFDFHTHAPVGEPRTVADPVSGYCGNTVTTVHLGGRDYSFWGSDSVTLTDILINLAYAPRPGVQVSARVHRGHGVRRLRREPDRVLCPLRIGAGSPDGGADGRHPGNFGAELRLKSPVSSCKTRQDGVQYPIIVCISHQKQENG